MRFIPIDGHIIDSVKQFAFYDTVVDRFVEVAGDEVWCCVTALINGFAWAPGKEALRDRLARHARASQIVEQCSECQKKVGEE